MCESDRRVVWVEFTKWLAKLALAVGVALLTADLLIAWIGGVLGV